MSTTYSMFGVKPPRRELSRRKSANANRGMTGTSAAISCAALRLSSRRRASSGVDRASVRSRSTSGFEYAVPLVKGACELSYIS